MADFPIASRTESIPAGFYAEGELVAGQNLASIVGDATLGNASYNDVTLTQFATRSIPAGKKGRVRVSIKIIFEEA